MEKETEARGHSLQVFLPKSLRNADSLFIFIEDNLGFRLDTLWNGPAPGDSILKLRVSNYKGDRASMVLRGFGPGALREELEVQIGPGQTEASPAGGHGIHSLSLQAPLDSASNLDTTLLLSWSDTDSLLENETWRVSLGGEPLPVLKSGLTSPRLSVSSLKYGSIYKWRVDRVSGLSVAFGPIRVFSTRVEPPRFLEYPADGVHFVLGRAKVIAPKTYRGGKASFSSSPALPPGFSLDSLGDISTYFIPDSLRLINGSVPNPGSALVYTITAENGSDTCQARVVIKVDSTEEVERGLVAHWDFEEGTGSILSDRSGNGHDGIISNGEWTNGVSGKGLWFNGANSRVTIPFKKDFNLGVYSLEAWIRTIKTKGDQSIIDRVVPSGNIWNYRMLIPGRDVSVNGQPFPKGVVQADVRSNFATSFEEIAFGKVFVADGRWHHVVVTNRSRRISIYVDGKLDTARIAGSDPAISDSTSQDLLLGDCEFPQVDFKFQGAMDEVRIYSYDLDSTEVRAHFKAIAAIPPIIGP